jgi:hypothetical protein
MKPGFTAECSLYKPMRVYVATPNYAALSGAGVVPALRITYCQNVVRGWVIENTLCGDCADFEVVCDPTCRGVQVTPWEHQCWEDEFAQ